MKKLIGTLLLLCMALSLFAGYGGGAWADVSNTIKGQSSSGIATASFGPCADDIRGLASVKYLRMPQNSSYFSDYQVYYVSPPGGHSVNTYRIPDLNDGGNKVQALAYNGVMFIGLAAENGFVCGIFPTADNERTAGWIRADNLSSTFPGKSVRFGNSAASSYIVYYSSTKWSAVPFVGSKTNFTEIVSHSGPSQAVDAISYEYQVLSRQGKNVIGERNVYINDGSGWEFVGRFNLDDSNETVRVNIYFDQPRVVKAVATVPSDPNSEGFTFRQYISGMMFKN